MVVRTFVRVVRFFPPQTCYLCLVVLGLILLFLYFFSLHIPIFTLNEPCSISPFYGNFSSFRPGFILALDYSDQLTGGAMNLLCLQCLAHRMDPMLVVVEPFLVRSTFGVSLDLNSPTQDSPWMKSTLRMSDIFNTTVWLEHSRSSCYSPLTFWEQFLNLAPRKVILAQHSWDDCSLTQVERSLAPFFQLHSFEVVRRVCFNFKTSGTLGLWRYKQNIYGDLEPTRTTLVYQKWMGVGNMVNKYTVSIDDSYCEKEIIGGQLVNNMHILPAQRLLTDANKYVSRFLPGIKDDKFIAIMVRFERIFMFLDTSPKIDKLTYLSKCLQNVVKKWKVMQVRSKLNQTFLAIDYGKYGSKGFDIHKHGQWHLLDHEVRRLLAVMGQGSLEEWQSRFSNATGTVNPGYIASVQQIIASRAHCLIVIGGGSFQEQTYLHHLHTHGRKCHIRLRSNCHLQDFLLPSSATS